MWFSICVHSHPNINIPFLPRPKVVFFCFVLLYIFCILMVGTVRTWGEFHYISLKPMKERKKGHAYTETITIHIKMPQTKSDFRLVHQLRFAWYFKSSWWSQLLCCTDTELIFPHQTYHYRSAHADLQSSSFSRNLQLFFFSRPQGSPPWTDWKRFRSEPGKTDVWDLRKRNMFGCKASGH